MKLVQCRQRICRSEPLTSTPTEATARAATEQPANSASESKPDHVVIFVHGMGEALKGGTLLEWSEPLITSLHDIAMDNIENNAPGTEPTPTALTIEAAHTTRDVPEIYVSVYKPGFASDSMQGPGFSSREDDPQRLLIMLTEAHWAEDFTPSKVGTTWLWGLTVAFRVWVRALNLIRWNLYPPLKIIDRHVFKYLWWVILLVPIGVVSLPVLALLLLMLGILIGLSKIPGIKPLAGKIVVLFGNFLGDPATWNRRPTQAAAMRQKVIDTVIGVPPNTNVTIVAHSQGAAVAGQVVLSGRVKITNFVTVGSGLPLLGYARYGENQCDDPVKEWIEHAPELRWINLWGKFDFVPAGPMARQNPDRKDIFKLLYGREHAGRIPSGPEEHPIFNRSAIIRDHIVYSQNRIDVIDPLAQLIYDNEDAPTKTPQHREELPKWFEPPAHNKNLTAKDEINRRRRHRRMVSFLGTTRVLAVCAGFFLALPVTMLTQLLIGSESGSRCGPTVFRWPCQEADFVWSTFRIEADWVLLIAVAAVAALFLWVLNGVLWIGLHRSLERRRDKHGMPWSGGKSYIFVYAGAVFLTTVVLPLFPLWVLWAWPKYVSLSSGMPGHIYVAYIVLAVILGAASLSAGKNLDPLGARL